MGHLRMFFDWLRIDHAEAQTRARKSGETEGYTSYPYGYDQGYTDALADTMKQIEKMIP